MRAAEPRELNTHTLPVLSAIVWEAELPKWFPVPFQADWDDIEGASKTALVRLEAGDYVLLLYSETLRQLTLRIPATADATAFLGHWFKEVPLPRARVTWRREDAQLPPERKPKKAGAPKGKTSKP